MPATPLIAGGVFFFATCRVYAATLRFAASPPMMPCRDIFFHCRHAATLCCLFIALVLLLCSMFYAMLAR